MQFGLHVLISFLAPPPFLVCRFWPVRSYPWGKCEAFSSTNSDLASLKRLLFEEGFAGLKQATETRYYRYPTTSLTELLCLTPEGYIIVVVCPSCHPPLTPSVPQTSWSCCSLQRSQTGVCIMHVASYSFLALWASACCMEDWLHMLLLCAVLCCAVTFNAVLCLMWCHIQICSLDCMSP